jgi:restriction system protein
MAVPDFQTIMLPLLQLAGDQQEHSIHEATDNLAALFSLLEAERAELLPSGKQAVFDNRVGWARTYLKKAGLVEPTKKTYFRITPLGLQVLGQNPTKVNVKFLQQFPGFLEFQKTNPKDKGPVTEEPSGTQTPDEALDSSYQNLRLELAQDLLSRVKNAPPAFFERLVVTRDA